MKLPSFFSYDMWTRVENSDAKRYSIIIKFRLDSNHRLRYKLQNDYTLMCALKNRFSLPNGISVIDSKVQWIDAVHRPRC